MRLRWNWAWTPVLGIAAAAIPNTVMIILAHRAPLDAVTADAHGDSLRFDAEQAARERYAASGLGWHTAPSATGVACRLDALVPAASIAAAEVRLYRPADRSLDRTVPWPDPAQELHVALPAAGPWFLELVLTKDGEELRERRQVVR